jgi:hypothetical protein
VTKVTDRPVKNCLIFKVRRSFSHFYRGVISFCIKKSCSFSCSQTHSIGGDVLWALLKVILSLIAMHRSNPSASWIFEIVKSVPHR